MHSTHKRTVKECAQQSALIQLYTAGSDKAEAGVAEAHAHCILTRMHARVPGSTIHYAGFS